MVQGVHDTAPQLPPAELRARAELWHRLMPGEPEGIQSGARACADGGNSAVLPLLCKFHILFSSVRFSDLILLTM